MIGPTEIAQLKDLWGKHESDRAPHYAVWTELEWLIQAGKLSALGTTEPFDSTITHANELLSASMAGSLTNQASRWFAEKMRTAALNDVKSIADWCDEVTERMFSALAASNFYTEVHENYLDLGAIGNTAILVEEDERPGTVRFTAVSAKEVCAVENQRSRVDTIFRKFPMTAAQIVARWGNRASDAVRTSAAGSDSSKKYDVLHVIRPRQGGQVGAGVLSIDLPFESVYVEYDSSALLEEGGFHEFPMPYTGWGKVPGAVYAYGPGHNARRAAKTLNKIVELKLKAAAKSIDPPLLVTEDGVIGKVRLTPAGINVVRSAMPSAAMSPPIQPLTDGSKFQVAELLEEEYKRSIHRIFFSDLLNLPEEGGQMTAREVIIRQTRMQQALGPTMGRLENWLSEILERVFGIMLRAGALPQLPEELVAEIQQGNGQIDIVYQGPLARAQRSEDALAIDEHTAWAIEVATGTQDPAILDTIKWDEAAWARAEVRGVPSKVLNSKEEVAATRGARAEAAAAQQAQQSRLAASEEMRNKAPYLKAVDEMGGGEDPEGMMEAM